MIEHRRNTRPRIRQAVVTVVALGTSIGLVGCGGTSATPTKPSGHPAGSGYGSVPTSSASAGSTPAGSPSAPATGSSQPSTNPSVALAPPSGVPATGSERRSAQQAVNAVDADFVAQNWAAIYRASASQIRQSQSLQTFVSSMQNQSMPRIVSATLTGAGSASTQNGSTYWTQPVELEVSYNGGAPAPYHAEVEMVDQGGTWACLATSTPKPGP